MHDKTIYRQRKQKELTAQAVEYAKRGWHVFPCKWNKTPYTSNGFYAATTDEERIISWFMDDFPDARIGIRTGRESGFWVVDIDMKNEKNGWEALEKQFGKTFYPEQTWLIQKTASGGFHFLFQWNDQKPVGNHAGLLAGVDTRGDGGYIIAAPSCIKVADAWCEYKWNDYKNGIIPEAPDWAWGVNGSPNPRIVGEIRN